MFRLDEPVTLLKPFDIDLRRKIVPEEDRDDKDEAGHKREAAKIMDVLGDLRDLREGLRADQGQQHDLAEGYIEPGEAKDDKGHRREPMRKSLKGPESEHGAPGPPP